MARPECACCGSPLGASLLDSGSILRFKRGTPEAEADPGTYRFCGMCLEYEVDPAMEVYRGGAWEAVANG